jgi:hypothetical protein
MSEDRGLILYRHELLTFPAIRSLPAVVFMVKHGST